MKMNEIFKIFYPTNIYFVFLSALVKKFLIHLHEQLESVVDEAVDGFVPMIFTVSVESWEHDRQNCGCVVTYQTHNIPKIRVTL